MFFHFGPKEKRSFFFVVFFLKKKERKKEEEDEIKKEIPTGLAFNRKLGSSVIQSDRDRPYCLGKLIPFCLRLSAIQPRLLKNLDLWCYTRQQGVSQVVFVSQAKRVSGGFGSCVRLTWPGPGCGPVLLCPTLGVFVVQWKAGGRQRQRLVLHGPLVFLFPFNAARKIELLCVFVLLFFINCLLIDRWLLGHMKGAEQASVSYSVCVGLRHVFPPFETQRWINNAPLAVWNCEKKLILHA